MSVVFSIIIRVVLASLFLGLVACVTSGASRVSSREIEAEAKQLLAKRERWGSGAFLVITQDNKIEGTWRVRAVAADSIPPSTSETRREMLFDQSGKLISYLTVP